MSLRGFSTKLGTLLSRKSLAHDLTSDAGSSFATRDVQLGGGSRITTHAMVNALKKKDSVTAYTASAWLLDPRHKSMRRWETLLALLLLFTATITPFEVAFLNSSMDTVSGLTMMVINRCVDLCFFTDLFINFNLSYYDPDLGAGMWVVNQRKIVLRYLTTHFFTDLFSTIPFELISMLLQSESLRKLRVVRVVRLLRLVKLMRLLRSGRLLARFEENMSVDYNMLTLIKFVVMVLALAHWLACGFHLVVRMEEASLSWVDQYFDGFGEPQPSISERYVAAFYWALVTMSTIGYGDVTPTTTAERCFGVVAMFAGTSIFAYVVGSVCTIVGNMDKRSNEFYELIDSLNAFMTENKFDQELRQRLRAFFRYRRRNATVQEYQILLQKMSPALRGEVATLLCGKWVNSIPFFHQAPTEFLEEIAQTLNVETFPQGEKIIHGGEVNERLFIVQRGVVGGKGRVFTAGKVFGEDILCGDGVSTYTARALTFADVYTLHRADLHRVCAAFPVMRLRLLQTGVRKRAKEALALFALQWTRLQKGIPASESLKGEHLKQTAVFLTATKLALMRKHHALTRFVQSMHDLNPSSTKPCLSLVEENLKKLHGVNLRSASVSEMRRLLPAETASCSSKNIGCKGGGTPSARQEGGDAASANNADDSMRLQSASPENIAVNVGLATQLSELKQLMLSSHDEARLLKEQMSEINRRLTVLEAVTKSQETR